jgi:NitT/TauT family transport system substrate-binding protein
MRLLADGRIDAYWGFAPDPQKLRAKKIGHVLVDTKADRPWSQYFCCLVTTNREFVRKHPVATK